MASFLNNLQTEQRNRTFKLLSPLTYVDDVKQTIQVPAGFVTDYATLSAFHNVVLFVVYALLVTYGNRAATIHDYLYSTRTYTRKECDDVFYRALRADGVAKWRAVLFWIGVRIGGASHY